MNSYRDGARAIAPIAVVVVAFGASFGVLARASGIETAAAIVMSATTFAGSAQFAAASILGTSGGIAAAVLAAVAPQRPLRADQRLGGLALRRQPTAQARRVAADRGRVLGVSRRPDGRFDRHLLIGAGLVLYACWVGGTAVGAIGGEALGDPADLGLDAAFPALFLALLVPQVRSRRALAAAIAGGTIALVLLPVTPAGVPIIAASAACLLGWRGP